MRRIIGLIASIFVVVSLAGCADDGSSYQSADYSRICVNENTHERVDGNQCGDNDSVASSGFLWWYLSYGRTLPAYGYPVTGGYQTVGKSSVIEHDEYLVPRGGASYTKAPTRSYSNGSGKKLGTTKGGSGYKAPAPVVPKNAPKAPSGGKAPGSSGGGYKAPAVKPPAPAAPRPIAPAPRPAPVRIK